MKGLSGTASRVMSKHDNVTAVIANRRWDGDAGQDHGHCADTRMEFGFGSLLLGPNPRGDLYEKCKWKRLSLRQLPHASNLLSRMGMWFGWGYGLEVETETENWTRTSSRSRKWRSVPSGRYPVLVSVGWEMIDRRASISQKCYCLAFDSRSIAGHQVL